MPITTLRYDGACTLCGTALPARSRAHFDPATRQVTCESHHEQAPARTADTPGGPAFAGHGSDPASARVFADRVRADYRTHVRETWGPLAWLVLLVRPEDQSVRNADKGAAGEEKVTAVLDRLAARSGGTVVVLHDRTIPGRRENVDHIVVAPSGVWAVDTKAYAGTIDTGGRWARNRSLAIGRRDGESLIAQSKRQQRHLAAAYAGIGLPALPTHGALCFVNATFAPGAHGSVVDGVTVTSPRRLRRQLAAPGPMTPEQVTFAAQRLHQVFTPAHW